RALRHAASPAGAPSRAHVLGAAAERRAERPRARGLRRGRRARPGALAPALLSLYGRGARLGVAADSARTRARPGPPADARAGRARRRAELPRLRVGRARPLLDGRTDDGAPSR